MSSTHRGTAGLALFTMLAAPAASAWGADQEVLVRAVGQLPRKDLVAYLARTAEPRTILAAEHPDYASLTFSDIAVKLCGIVPDGYFESVAILNPGSNIDPTAVAGASAFRLEWPACFQVRSNVVYTIRKYDNPSSIRLQLTGEFAAGPELDAYFQPAGVDPRNATLQPGKTLQLPFETLKTKVLIPNDKVATFISDLKTGAGRRVQIEMPHSHGQLVGPFGGATLGTDQDCTYETDERYPFSALEVANAYDALREQQNTVYVAVVDNGFFGVPCSDAGCPGPLIADSDFSPRFPKEFFAPPSFYTNYGSTLGVSYILEPLNYHDLKAGDVDDVSGHGTHVAGLVLGGPTFAPFRGVLSDGRAGRLALSIVAVAHGTLDLDAQTEGRIRTAIESMVSPMLVNLSIAFDDPATEGVFKGLVGDQRILFVAAAGNDSEDLDQNKIYPASLGGRDQPNLITVASIDSTGKLSSFSNYGQEVDIASPGCKVSSWLNAEGPDVTLSGTSQAAPLVTFASALLFSKLQPITPRAVKNRLIYSGDLIQDPASRRKIWSGTRLAIPKALFVDDDFIFVREGPGFGAYLGDLEPFTGLACGTKERDFADVRSLKRVSSNEVWIYTETAAGPVSVCSGKLPDHTAADPTVAMTLNFRARARLQGASIVPVDPTSQSMRINAADLIELVRRMPNLH